MKFVFVALLLVFTFLCDLCVSVVNPSVSIEFLLQPERVGDTGRLLSLNGT
jgi:hypothetical protein